MGIENRFRPKFLVLNWYLIERIKLVSPTLACIRKGKRLLTSLEKPLPPLVFLTSRTSSNYSNCVRFKISIKFRQPHRTSNCIIVLAMLMYIVLLFTTYAVEYSSLECSSNSDCLLTFFPKSGYCCRQRYSSDESRCTSSGCIGQTCARNQDCGGPNECCRNNICADCSDLGCLKNSDCFRGKYCCRRNGHGICRYSCERQLCSTTDDCGAPGECCVQNRCTTSGCDCQSNANCKFGEYCCRSGTNRTCSFSCIGKGCLLSDSDCGAPGEDCTYPDSDCFNSRYNKKCLKLPEYKCFNKNGCYSHKDCDVFGSGYYCCASGRSCNSNCLKKYCDKDADCGGSSECCDPNINECARCPNKVPAWIIGTTVGISLLVIAFFVVVIRYIVKKKKQTTQDQPSEIDMDENSRPQNSQNATLQNSDGISFIDDIQSFVQPAGTTSPYVMSSNGSLDNELKREERYETGLPTASTMPYSQPSAPTILQPQPSAPTMPYPQPSAPTMPYSVSPPPPDPPPSYQKLFGHS